MTFDGSAAENLTISGGDNHRVFFVDAEGGSVAIRDLTIANGSATGGTGGGGNAAGGGGGLGAGGGVFVNQGAVTIERVNFSSNSATGGAGGSATGRSGISNNTSNPLNGGGVGGGGGGLQGPGGNNSLSDRRGGTGAGGLYGGGATTLETTTPNSQAPPVDEGVGGQFGGDGGRTVEVTIDGADHTEYQGGGGSGGAGLGGAIFVRENNGASLELIDVTESGSGVTSGQGGSGFGAGTDGQDGQAHGSGLFLGGGATTLRVSDGQEDFMTGTIAESQASSLVKEGAGNLALTGNNTFTGGVTVNDGTLTLFSQSAGSGDINLDGGALGYFANQDIDNDIVLHQDGELNIGGGIGASVVQTGDISETGGSHDLIKTGDGTIFLEGELTYTGRTYVEEGVLNIASATLNGQQFDAQAVEEGRVIGGADGVVGFVEAGTEYTSVTAVETGKFSGMVVDAGGTFINGSNFLINGDLTNHGTTNLTGSILLVNRIFNTGTLQGEARIIIADPNADGAIDNSGNIFLTNDSFITGGVNNRDGANILMAGDSTFFNNVTNDGTIRVTSGGSVTFVGDFTGSGDFTGAGRTVFGGTFRPGNSPGAVSFEGDVTFENDLVLEMELAGLEVGEFDFLSVDGELVLDGTLVVSYLDDFVAEQGDSFLLISSTDYTGTFDDVILPDAQNWLINYGSNGVEITAIPEPTVFVMLLVGLMILASVRRRQSKPLR